MHNIVANFDQILDFARQISVPVQKKRGVVREYLQAKFVSMLYSLPGSEKLSFVGGTGLRLLRDLPRFSEDLDFDNLGLSNAQIEKLVLEAARRFEAEGLSVELSAHLKEGKTYYDIKFPKLLEELKITTNPKEKLMIKFDYSDSWRGQKTEVVLFNKYGFIENVVTNSINQVLVQKLAAYVFRKNTQPRDMYDVVWLFSRGAVPDADFAKINGFGDIVARASNKYASEGLPGGFKSKLEPFLFVSGDVRKLELFEGVLDKPSGPVA